MACDAKCWTDVECTTCGRTKALSGRSDPFASSRCSHHDCEGYYRAPKAPHLWSEHDSDRAYTDAAGWEAHVASCARCNPSEDSND